MKSVDIMKCKLVRESNLSYQNITGSQEAVEIFKAFGLADAADEIFAIICLDAKGAVNAVHEISHGDLTTSIVNPREIFKRACANNAAGLILGHNHPSANCTPSQEDIAVTRRISEAGQIMGIRILDHIIIGVDNFTSFAAEGLL